MWAHSMLGQVPLMPLFSFATGASALLRNYTLTIPHCFRSTGWSRQLHADQVSSQRRRRRLFRRPTSGATQAGNLNCPSPAASLMAWTRRGGAKGRHRAASGIFLHGGRRAAPRGHRFKALYADVLDGAPQGMPPTLRWRAGGAARTTRRPARPLLDPAFDCGACCGSHVCPQAGGVVGHLLRVTRPQRQRRISRCCTLTRCSTARQGHTSSPSPISQVATISSRCWQAEVRRGTSTQRKTSFRSQLCAAARLGILYTMHERNINEYYPFSCKYICINNILCLIIVIHHKRHHFITRTTSNAGTKKMSVPSFGSFIKLIMLQCTGSWVSPRRRVAARPIRVERGPIRPTISAAILACEVLIQQFIATASKIQGKLA